MSGDAHTVHGITHDGQYGEVTLTPTKKGWLQLGWGATAHLKREYVCGETLQEVLDEWIPHDLRGTRATKRRWSDISE